ncbi:YciI family protein [Roseibium algae]|uniref:YCII-related domain-containing protein n=1 Tax=Roseibium algae TaxID=3123038 RepID=A0ABU8TH71_9HYPH
MFAVFLTFGPNRSKAPDHMDGHNGWIRQGFEDGVFLMAGSLVPGKGGMVLAHNASRDDLEARVALDPFVQEQVVTAEIHEIQPSRVDERLSFLTA